MPKWTEYTSKDTLADNDEVMLYDATARANKRGLMSKFWNYVVDKMSTAVISKLETNNKTIIGAINALNSETKIVDSANNCSFMKVGNIVFVTMTNFVAKDYIIPSKYIPHIQRTITGIISFSAEGVTFVVDCDIETSGEITPHYKDTLSTRIGDNTIHLFGTAFYII